LRHFTEIDSTNEEAKRLATAGVKGPLWLVADCQTKGRGRRGRDWQSPLGNVSATLLLNPSARVAKCAQLSFVAAISVFELIVRCAPQSSVKLKWPNDVLVEERKIAGILLETAGKDATAPDWLAIGFGINLASHPVNTEFPATSLAALGIAPPRPLDAMASLATSWSEWYDVWMRRGFPPIRDAWLARAAGLGSRIRARLPTGEISGVFEGIDYDGALLLRERPDRLRVIAAAEVFF
jgi:BirA family biotin operon repressor/biotin-[acetyl-CoA-carboxylase] ligase